MLQLLSSPFNGLLRGKSWKEITQGEHCCHTKRADGRRNKGGCTMQTPDSSWTHNMCVHCMHTMPHVEGQMTTIKRAKGGMFARRVRGALLFY